MKRTWIQAAASWLPRGLGKPVETSRSWWLTAARECSAAKRTGRASKTVFVDPRSRRGNDRAALMRRPGARRCSFRWLGN